jgi:hypothetical protein
VRSSILDRPYQLAAATSGLDADVSGRAAGSLDESGDEHAIAKATAAIAVVEVFIAEAQRN